MADDVIRIDQAACLKGGEIAGQYLDEIGVTDLALLRKDQWEKFCFLLVGHAFMAASHPPATTTPPF